MPTTFPDAGIGTPSWRRRSIASAITTWRRAPRASVAVPLVPVVVPTKSYRTEAFPSPRFVSVISDVKYAPFFPSLRRTTGTKCVTVVDGAPALEGAEVDAGPLRAESAVEIRPGAPAGSPRSIAGEPAARRRSFCGSRKRGSPSTNAVPRVSPSSVPRNPSIRLWSTETFEAGTVVATRIWNDVLPLTMLFRTTTPEACGLSTAMPPPQPLVPFPAKVLLAISRSFIGSVGSVSVGPHDESPIAVPDGHVVGHADVLEQPSHLGGERDAVGPLDVVDDVPVDLEVERVLVPRADQDPGLCERPQISLARIRPCREPSFRQIPSLPISPLALPWTRLFTTSNPAVPATEMHSCCPPFRRGRCRCGRS